MNRKGQAILESLLVLLILLAAFFFFFDFAYGMVTQYHLNNAAARSARADTVGFNAFQRVKAARVAMVPVSGKREVPDQGRVVANAAAELALIRTYLQSENDSDARGILHYERWDTLGHQVKRKNHQTQSTLTFEVPLSFPSQLGGLFGMKMSETGTRRLSSTWAIEDHASYYLKDSLND